MRVHYYGQDWSDGRCNLGDWVTLPLMRALGHQPEPPEPGQPVLFGVGSILGPEHYSAGRPSRIVVWGSGILNLADNQPGLANFDVRAVRGPLTRSRLGLDHSVPMGDPALLVPFLLNLPKPAETEEVLYLTHCGNYEPPKSIEGFDTILSMLSTHDDAPALVSRIAHAKFVASESLHGCILAAAFGRPWAPCSSREGVLQDKWADWFTYLGLIGPGHYLPADYPTAMSWWKHVGQHGMSGPTKPLLESFPCSL